MKEVVLTQIKQLQQMTCSFGKYPNLFVYVNLKIFLRDAFGEDTWYEPISVIEHKGTISGSDMSSGHYICDIKEKTTNNWYRTSDDSYPLFIDSADVSQLSYAILFQRIDY